MSHILDQGRASASNASPGGECSLYFFAHQDDELGVLPWLREDRRAGRRVHCFFLTSGAVDCAAGGRPLARRRDAETLRVLGEAGIAPGEIHFVGGDCLIDDGGLYLQMARADHACSTILDALPRVARYHVYGLAWEGGHHDHDAAHLIALAQATRLQATARAFQFSLYNGRGLPGALFNVLAPLPENGPQLRKCLPRQEALGIWLKARRYPSQWRTWAGLLPPILLKMLLRPEFRIQPLDPARVGQRPHAGPLYYERRFGIAFQTFMQHAGPFIAANLPAALERGAPQG